MKIAIVTGGNRGIGFGITKSFVEAGYFVFVGSRKKIDFASFDKDKIQFVFTDVREEKSHENLVNIAMNKFGRIDVCWLF